MTNAIAVKTKTQIATLGDADVLIKQDAKGYMKAIKCEINLSEKNGEVAEVTGKFLPTVAGYRKINQVASVSFIHPERIVLPEGKEVPNPYPIVDRVSGTIEKVWTKLTGVGYNKLGNLQVVTATLLYDVNLYFAEALLKKVQYNKGSGRVCMKSMLTEEELKTGIFMPTQSFGDEVMGIWADMNHPEIIKAVSTYIQDKKFAERKAQGIIERNITKALTGITCVDASGQKGNAIAKVSVVGWTHDLTREEIETIANKAHTGETEHNGQKIDFVEADYSSIEEDDLVAGRDEEEEIAPASEESKEKFTVEDPVEQIELVQVNEDEEKKSVVSYIRQAANVLGEEVINETLQQKFKKTLDELNLKQLKMAQKIIDAEIDKQEVF